MNKILKDILVMSLATIASASSTEYAIRKRPANVVQIVVLKIDKRGDDLCIPGKTQTPGGNAMDVCQVHPSRFCLQQWLWDIENELSCPAM